MKKAVQIAIMVLFSASLQAQMQSQLAESIGPLTTVDNYTVVSNYDSVHVVGFMSGTVSGMSKAYFYVADANENTVPFAGGSWMEAPITGMRVKDICTNGNYAYFCGVDNIGNILCGRFQMAPILAGTNMSLCEIYIGPKQDTLYRMSVVGSDTVVAIGRENIYSFTLGTPSLLSRFEINYSSSTQEELYDIVQYNGYIFFFGTNLDDNAMTIRRCSASSLISDPAIFFTRQYTPPASTVTPHGCCATLLPQGRFSVAHQTVDSDVNIELVTIDASTMNCLSRQNFANQHRVQFLDMKYMPTSERLVMLYHDDHTLHSPIIEWIPSNTSPYLANTLIPDEPFTSLDRLTPDSFIAAGYNIWLEQNTPAGIWQQSCQPLWHASIEPKPLPLYSTKSSGCSNIVPSGIAVYNLKCVSYPAIINCIK